MSPRKAYIEPLKITSNTHIAPDIASASLFLVNYYYLIRNLPSRHLAKFKLINNNSTEFLSRQDEFMLKIGNTQDTLDSLQQGNTEDCHQATQRSNSQESVHSRLAEVETKLKLLEELQCASAKQSAEKSIQIDSEIDGIKTSQSALRDSCLQEFTDKLKKSSQQVEKLLLMVHVNGDSITRLEKATEVWSEKIRLLQESDKNVVLLKDVLNKLHLKVEKRQELGEKMSDLRNELVQHVFEVREAVSNEMTGVQGDLNQRMMEIQSELSSVETALGLIMDTRDDKQMMPAFSATLASNQLVVRPGDTILFSQTLLNKWDCYDAVVSRFTSPASGVYFFNVSLNTNSAKSLSVAIVLNGNETSLCYCPAMKDVQTSTSIALYMSTGDQVWVKAESQTDTNGVEIGKGFSNFMGVRLH